MDANNTTIRLAVLSKNLNITIEIPAQKATTEAPNGLGPEQCEK